MDDHRQRSGRLIRRGRDPKSATASRRGFEFSQIRCGIAAVPEQNDAVVLLVDSRNEPCRQRVIQVKPLRLARQLVYGKNRGIEDRISRFKVALDQDGRHIQGRPHIVDMMKDGMVSLVINTTEGAQSIADSFSIRRTALLGKIAYTTTLSGALATVDAISAMKTRGLDVKPLQAYFK